MGLPLGGTGEAADVTCSQIHHELTPAAAFPRDALAGAATRTWRLISIIIILKHRLLCRVWGDSPRMGGPRACDWAALGDAEDPQQAGPGPAPGSPPLQPPRRRPGPAAGGGTDTDGRTDGDGTEGRTPTPRPAEPPRAPHSHPGPGLLMTDVINPERSDGGARGTPPPPPARPSVRLSVRPPPSAARRAQRPQPRLGPAPPP